MATKTTDKDELIRMVKEYLALHKSVDLRVFITDKWENRFEINPIFISDIANRLRQGAKYEIKTTGIGAMESYIISRKNWRERNPFWNEVRTGLITFLFSVAASLLLFLIQDRASARHNTQQTEYLIRLSDSIKNLEKQLTDSVKAVRLDMKK